jgi:hypothetical protein
MAKDAKGHGSNAKGGYGGRPPVTVNYSKPKAARKPVTANTMKVKPKPVVANYSGAKKPTVANYSKPKAARKPVVVNYNRKSRH